MFKRYTRWILFISVFTIPVCPEAFAKVNPFLEAQHCRIANHIDILCFQQKQAEFEQFVLLDDAGWLPKSIVGEALLQYYDAAHVSTPGAETVRAKVAIYKKAVESLSKSQQGEIEDCKDEGNPYGCMRSRYCPKETYITIKNFLATNEPEKFQAELKRFDLEIKGVC